jgi:cAMP phosphodiesterase
MKIDVLGCAGSEFPGYHLTGFRLDDTVMLDAGTLTAVLTKAEQARIKDILVSHAHLDHTSSIPFLADNVILANKGRRINVLSISSVIRTIQNHLLNNRVWPDVTICPTLQSAPLRLVALKEGASAETSGHTITPYKMRHTVPAVGYLIEDRKGRRLFYAGDTGPGGTAWARLGKTRLHGLIIEVSFPNRMRSMAILTGHLTPNLLKEELVKLEQMPEAIYITHVKPHYRGLISRELEKLNINSLRLLKDGETIRI